MSATGTLKVQLDTAGPYVRQQVNVIDSTTLELVASPACGEEVEVPAGSIVKFPSNVPHDVRNLGAERCVIMFLKINPKVLKGAVGG